MKTQSFNLYIKKQKKASEFLFLSVLLFALVSISFSQSVIQLPNAASDRKSLADDSLYCDSWRLSVETNNAGRWGQIPSRCETFVREYMTGELYLSDSEVIANFSNRYAASINTNGDGKHAWVFDIDQTLLSASQVPSYYQQLGYRSESNKEIMSYGEEVELLPILPALPASLRLYNDIKHLGFKIFLITGRNESLRVYTENNLLIVGYNDWEMLIMRGDSDEGKSATQYKSEKRSELINQGYMIHGNSGDQWSDLLGFAVAIRSFKLPNIMYYIA